MSLIDMLRAEARLAPVSGIEAVANYGRGRPGLIPLWAGEGDLPTPDFISAAAMRGARATARPSTPGRAAFRNCARRSPATTARHFGLAFSPDEFLVTDRRHAGDHAGAAGDGRRRRRGDLPDAGLAEFRRRGRRCRRRCRCRSRSKQGDNGWYCDVDQGRSRGDAAHEGDLRQHAGQPDRLDRRHRDAEGDPRPGAPARACGSSPTRSTRCSTMAAAARRPSWTSWSPRTRILFVNTFSKNWAMTGWRIGWLRAHPSLGRMFENLIQYSTSGVAQFLQRGAIAALDEGDEFLASQVERAQAARDLVCRKLAQTGRVRFSVPPGRVLPVLLGRRRHGFRESRLRHRRQGRRRPGARHRLRQGGRGVSEALLPPPPRPGRGSRQPAGGVDQEGVSLTRRTSAPAAG